MLHLVPINITSKGEHGFKWLLGKGKIWELWGWYPA